MGPKVTPGEVRDLLRRRIEEAGSTRAASRALGVSAAYLIDVRHGRRAAGDRLLSGLGLERVVVPVEPAEGAAHVA
ncbi:hypothetical protein ACFPYM_25300 [Methylobacterium hispanicum]|nr:transcriptional regulator [Methylobacterium hispanicum]